MEDYYWAKIGSAVANLVFIATLLNRFLPSKLFDFAEYYLHNFINWFHNDITISYEEFPFIDSGYTDRSKPYKHVEAYLEQRCFSSTSTNNLKAKPGKGKRPMKFILDDFEKVRDEYRGIKVEWFLDKHKHKDRDGFLQSRRTYQLTFHRRHRDTIINSYIKFVDEEGKKIVKQSKFQKIYNNEKEMYGMPPCWNSSSFEHPSSFDTLALEPSLKQKIVDDLEAFRKGEEYYKRIGKSWKRGYLLYGPPGTGKSSLIAAMANLLQYDIYNLELTAIKNNVQLNKLLQETSKKSILVIEDIDCTLDLTLTSKRDQQENKKQGGSDPQSQSQLTLSGLLNSIDGLTSGCVQERIIVFTTNHVEKLDPALIRRGRMDMHVEMSYCRFEAFKVLAENYLNLETHPLFEKVRVLLEEVDMAPADVAENLMPKCLGLHNQGEFGLQSLISALEEAKEAAAMLKAQVQQQQITSSNQADGDHIEPSLQEKEEQEAHVHEKESTDHIISSEEDDHIISSEEDEDDED